MQANQTYLIDEIGDLWSINSPQFAMRWGRVADAEGLSEFLARNTGMILVRKTRSGYKLRLAAGQTSGRSILGLSEVLDDDQRYSLSWYNGQWHHELFGSKKSLLKRIAMLNIGRRSPTASPLLSAHRNLRDELEFNQHKKLLTFWKTSGGHLNLMRDTDSLYAITGGKFFVVEKKAQGADMVYAKIGRNVDAYEDRKWREDMTGQDVGHQPDFAYGEWIANTYREAMMRREPELLDIDAKIKTPRTGSAVHKRYTRIALPFAGYNGSQYLLCSSFPNSRVDLRIKVHHEFESIVDKL